MNPYRFFLICSLLLLPLSASAMNNKLTLLTENYPPFNMSIDDRNFARGDSVDGVATDIVRELMKRANVEYSLTLRFPWSKLYKLTLNKQGYGLFSTARTAEREDLFKWVGPIVSDDFVIFARKGETYNISSLNDLKDFTIGGYKDDFFASKLKAKGLNVVEALKDNTNATKLQNGRIDFWATGLLSGPYGADQMGISGGMDIVYRVEKNDFYLALNKSVSDELVQRLQKSLDSMQADGTLKEIYSQYY